MVLVKVELVIKNRLVIFLKRLAIFLRHKKHSKGKGLHSQNTVMDCSFITYFGNFKMTKLLIFRHKHNENGYLLAFYLFYIFWLETTSQNVSLKIRNYCTKMQNQG